GARHRYAPLQEGGGGQGIFSVGVIDWPVAAPELPWSERVAGADREHGVVGDRGRQLAVALAHRDGGDCKLSRGQWSRGDRIEDLATDEVDREAHVADADVAFAGVTG